MEARARGGEESPRGEGKSDGMKRIPMTSTGLNIQAENNNVRVSTDSYQRTIDLVDYSSNTYFSFFAYRE